MEYYAASDKGLIRERDEDSLATLHTSLFFSGEKKERALFILADGLGGHRAGEVASREAVKKFLAEVSEYLLSEKEYYWPDILENALKETNKALYEYSLRRPAYAGMGTTLISALISEDTLFAISVGDSRLYILKEKELFQVTKDHSVVQEMIDRGEISKEEARHHPKKSLLTRAVGIEPSVEADHYSLDLKGCSQILLCCDGLTDVVSDEEIRFTLMTSQTPEKACKSLIEMANKAGGPDNISLILIRL